MSSALLASSPHFNVGRMKKQNPESIGFKQRQISFLMTGVRGKSNERPVHKSEPLLFIPMELSKTPLENNATVKAKPDHCF